jgi:UDP-glucose 4-epimerase
MKIKTFIIGARSNLSQQLQKMTNVSLISGRNLNQLSLEIPKVEKCNIIYNLFYPSFLSKGEMSNKNVNLYTTEKLREFINICNKNKNIRNLIYSSSAGVYGNKKSCSLETDVPSPINLNGRLKFFSEQLLKNELINKRINLIIARIFNMYGYKDRFSIIHKIENAIKSNEYLKLYNSGNQIRDFVHVQDVATIYLKLINSNYQGVINIGTGKGVKIISLFKKLKNLYNIKIKKKKYMHNPIYYSVASVDKLFETIGKYKFKNLSDYLQL